jgi:hypothetical protein
VVQQVGAAGGLLNGTGGTGSLTSSGDLPTASSPTAAGAAAVAAGFAGVPIAGAARSVPPHRLLSLQQCWVWQYDEERGKTQLCAGIGLS